jgi:hypothetical protein
MTSKLSYEKFSKLLTTHNYILTTVYFTFKNSVKTAIFLEVKLPKTQKSILVRIPLNKYIMNIPSDIKHRSIEIIKAKENNEALTEKSLHYLLNIRGPLLENDLTSISIEGICHSKFNGECYCYFFASNISQKLIENNDNLIDKSEEDEIELMEKEVKNIANKAKIKLKNPLKLEEKKSNETKNLETLKKNKKEKKLLVKNKILKSKETGKSDKLNKKKSSSVINALPRQCVSTAPPGLYNENTLEKNNLEEKSSDFNEVKSAGSAKRTALASRCVLKHRSASFDRRETHPQGGASFISDREDSSKEVELFFKDGKTSKSRGLSNKSSSEEESSVSINENNSTSSEDVLASSSSLSQRSRSDASSKEKDSHCKRADLCNSEQEKSSQKINNSHKNIDNNTLTLSMRTNYVIPDELDVNLGVIYVVVDVDTLYKNIKNYELTALDVYEQIDENEKDMRISRVDVIKKNIILASNHLETRIKNMDEEEKALKWQLLRLTNILRDAQDIKTRSNQKDFNNSKGMIEVNRVYNKTRKTVHELNVKLLKHRDDIEEILINYEEVISELIEL